MYAKRVRPTYSEMPGQNVVATKIANDSIQCMLRNLEANCDWKFRATSTNYRSADKIQTYSTQHMLTNLEAESAWW